MEGDRAVTAPARRRVARAWQYWVTDVAAGLRLWLAHELLRALPTSAASRIGGFIGRSVGSRLYPAEHLRARETIRAVRPDLAADGAMLSATLARCWDNIGRSYAEISAEYRLWDEHRIDVEGAELLAHLAKEGLPVIVAGLHLGNWELLPITLCRLGHHVVCVYDPPPNRFVDRIAKRVRLRSARVIAAARRMPPSDMFRLVPPSTRAGTDLVRAVRSGWTMMMYVDEDVRGKCFAPALGRTLPREGNLLRVARIARLTGAVIVPAYVERRDDARFVVRLLPRVDAQGDAAATVAALNEAIAGPVRRHLDQWLMLLTYRLRK